MAVTRRFDNPYVGPRPFQREDSGRFFGRDREAGELVSLTIANRTVLLYAQSGAGKTSLLNAMVIPELEEEGFEVLPQARVYGPDLDNMQQDEIENIYVLNTLLIWAGDDAKTADLSHTTISEYLANMPEQEDEFGYVKPRVILFDQFEELFTTYPNRWQDREGFFNQIHRALHDNELLHVVFSMREDYIAQLDAYASLLPRQLRTRYRLERMRAQQALAAIRGPLVGTQRRFTPAAADQLVSELRKVQVESVSGELITTIGEFIEPVQLQVVCQNLWDDLPTEIKKIDRDDLQAFGNVDQALGRFYERAIGEALPLTGASEETFRHWFEAQLITPAGTRATVYRGEQKTAEINNDAVQILEDFHILRGEFRAGARWYELTHDRLLEPIRQSNRDWEAAQREQQFARLRRIGIPIVAGLTIIALMALLYAFGTGSQAAADTQAVETRIFATQAIQAEATANTNANATLVASEATAIYNQNIAATANALAAEATGNASAFAAEATGVAIAAMATAEFELRATEIAAAEAAFERVRELALERPLRTGALLSGATTETEGHLSIFVQDAAGQYYLLTVAQAVEAMGDAVMQPSLANNGNPDTDTIGRAVEFPDGVTKTDLLENLVLVRLNNKVPFSIAIPELGPIRGVTINNSLTIIGTDGNSQNYTISSEEARRESSEGPKIISIPEAYEPGLEGALVIDDQGFAVGIVIGENERAAQVALLEAVLEEIGLSLVYIGRPLLSEPLDSVTRMESIAFSADGRLMATGGLSVNSDFPVLLWQSIDDGQSWAALPPLVGHINTIEDVVFSPDNRYLVASSLSNDIIIWLVEDIDENEDIQPFRTLQPHIGTVRTVAFSPDGQFMASAADDRQIFLYDTNNFDAPPITVATRGTPNRHDGNINDMVFTPDGRFLITAGDDSTVRLWYLRNDGLYPDVTTLQERHNGTVDAIDVTQRDEIVLLASGSSDRSVFLWDLTEFLANPTQSAQFKTTFSGHTLPILTIDFSQDGAFLAAGSVDDTIRLWDISNPLLPSVLITGHTDDVLGVAFLPNGTALGSISQDRTIRLWETRKQFNN